MAKYVDSQLFVGDVYDLAAEIGKEFEKLIDEYGCDIIRDLMAKVIVTLEYLESSALVIDRLKTELLDIRVKVQQLEHEKLERAEFRLKLDQELEAIEENWRKETNQLSSLVMKLQEENKRLSQYISEKELCAHSDHKAILSDEELVIVKRLKELTEHHRTQLIAKDRELIEKNADSEKMLSEIERLSSINKELSHKNRHLQKQLYSLVEEKSDLQANIQNQEKEIEELHLKLNTAVIENRDLTSLEELHGINLQGKLVINLDDPNRPRFTLDELRHILFERNDLKAKINDLEEELSFHKPKPRLSSTLSTISTEKEDLPVQGPINKEPEEKLFPDKKKLGIRRLLSVDTPVH